ncbi:MAG: hypothetical protein H8E84_05770 [Flavobacteriales bacterium]|nr:hypothetical protein [Flavobacteriales bacterium]
MIKKFIILFFLGTILLSCEKDKIPVELVDYSLIRDISFQNDLQPIFDKQCGTQGCHSYFEAAGKLDLQKYAYLDLTQEKSHEFPNMYRVKPNNLDSSVLIQKLNKNSAFGVGMPASLVGANIVSIPLTGDSSLMMIKAWIMQGAKEN